MLYFQLEREDKGFRKGKSAVRRRRKAFGVLMKDSRVAEETDEKLNPKGLPLGFLLERQEMRKPRIYLKEAVYYTTVKANAEELLFREDADYLYFLKILKQRKTKYNFKLYGYCLLPKHYHLLIETQDKNISKIMQAINTSYTLYFNNKYKRKGHLLAGRFGMKIVEKDASLLDLTYHIHLNPLRAGIVKMPEDYPFSSYSEYIKDKDELLTDSNDILLYLGPLEDKEALQKRYQQIIIEEKVKKESPPKIREDETTIILEAEKINKKILKPEILVGIGSGLLVILVLVFVGIRTGVFRQTRDKETLNRKMAVEEVGALRTGMLSLPDGLPQVEDRPTEKQVWELWKN